MTVFLVREEAVPAGELRRGDRLILPSGRRVTVDRVDEFDDGLIVRWWRPAERGEPGFRGGKQHADAVSDEWDGRYLGSTLPVLASHVFRVDRG